MVLPSKVNKPIYILSIAGGGIKGVIAAQFFKRMEEEMGDTIYNKFDMFAGNSIGSLIMGALVYTNTTAQELSDNVFTLDNAQKIMNKSFWDYVLGRVQSRPYYDGKGKRKIIDNYVGDKLISETTKNTIFVSYDIENNKPKFFKSWEYKDAHIKVKDATDSSSAAPCFFPSVEIEGTWYMDGGICANYPTDCVYADALKMYGKDADIRILCIGAGYPKFRDVGSKSKKWGALQWIGEGDLMGMLIDSSERTTNYRMNTFTQALGHKYLRVNDYIDNTSTDDVSSENVANLKKIGDEWWELFGTSVLEFMKD